MWLWSGGLDAPDQRVYPSEELDWVEEQWDVEAEKLKGAVGYTLESLQEGQVRARSRRVAHLPPQPPS